MNTNNIVLVLPLIFLYCLVGLWLAYIEDPVESEVPLVRAIRAILLILLWPILLPLVWRGL